MSMTALTEIKACSFILRSICAFFNSFPATETILQLTPSAHISLIIFMIARCKLWPKHDSLGQLKSAAALIKILWLSVVSQI